jgi:hypothetical protein
MHAELSNLSLLAHCIAKAALLTGLGPGLMSAILFHKFGVGALRPEQSESGHVSGVKLEFVSDFLSASSASSGDGQLAPACSNLIPVNLSSRATSPSRKIRRSA